MTFSPAHWTDAGDKIAIIATQMQDITMPWGQGSPNWQPGRLAWVDSSRRRRRRPTVRPIPPAASAFDYLAAHGRSRIRRRRSRPGATTASRSSTSRSRARTRDSRTAAATQDGRLYKGAADLYEIPYANKAGGTATPVAGASTPDNEEYYPAFSPDDKLIAFTRVPAGQEMFANPNAEMWVVPHQAGAQAQRLTANDPPASAPASRAPASTTTGRSGRPTG